MTTYSKCNPSATLKHIQHVVNISVTYLLINLPVCIFLKQEVKLILKKLESPVAVALERKGVDIGTATAHENDLHHLLSVNWDNLNKLYLDRLA